MLNKTLWKYYFALSVTTFAIYTAILVWFLALVQFTIPNATAITIELNGLEALSALIVQNIWMVIHGAVIYATYNKWKKEA